MKEENSNNFPFCPQNAKQERNRQLKWDQGKLPHNSCNTDDDVIVEREYTTWKARFTAVTFPNDHN